MVQEDVEKDFKVFTKNNLTEILSPRMENDPCNRPQLVEKCKEQAKRLLKCKHQLNVHLLFLSCGLLDSFINILSY